MKSAWSADQDITEGITRAQINTMREADAIIPRYIGELDPENYGERGSWLEFTRTIRDPKGVFEPVDQRCRMATLHPRIENWTNTNWAEGTQEFRYGPIAGVTWVLMSLRVDRPWHTFVSCLKPGDQVRPHYQVGNDSNNTRNAGVTYDQFSLEVIRRPSGREVNGRAQQFDFILDHSITPVHAIGRNVRFGAREEYL